MLRSKASEEWSIPNFLPQQSASEDDEFIERHRLSLKQQLRKMPDRRDDTIIRDSTQATLSHKQHLVVKESASLEKIQAEYPILFYENEVCTIIVS